MENPNGIVAGNNQNIPEAQTPRTRSTFDLGYHMFDTHRFGEYHPHFIAEGVKGDILPIRSSHNVMSYTLKSPLMQNIKMVKDYFLVPDQAILPLNWDKYFENPVRGDDVPNDVGPTVENFWTKISNFMQVLSNAYNSHVDNPESSFESVLTATFRYLILGEYFYSNGSLLASLGCHGSQFLNLTENGVNRSWDYFFDTVISALVEFWNGNDTYFTMTVDGYAYTVGVPNKASSRGVISLRHALSLMRDNIAFDVTTITTGGRVMIDAIKAATNKFVIRFYAGNVPCRLERLWAYQLVVAHYYSNDHIDFIYSADLYRQLVLSYWLSYNNQNVERFTMNGISYEYDALSAHYFDEIMSLVTTYPLSLFVYDGFIQSIGSYFPALFAFRRSLRYLDYFTGSRSQPLAVGSTGVSVVNNMVDVIDVTRNIQRQRFLNAVNRVRHNTEGYLKGIFGGDTPAPDYHNPFYLAHTDDSIYGQETENTAAAQFEQPIAISTNLRSNGSRYMFEMHCDRPCILIGITSYDIPRVYTKTIERPFFHVDRFDMFNPFMQYIGDQPVYLQELGISPGGGSPANLANFAYSLRHMEFKQRFNQAAGGFVENLPGFAFLALDERGNESTINPDWIRSVPSEFDNFYVSLTGYSNGSYFHFIVDNFNDCSGSRPMAYAPSILS